MERTGRSESYVESAIDRLSQLVPRVSIPGASLDKQHVRVAISANGNQR